MYFLNIYKPKGITSFDVISKLRKRLNIRQIGHAGTLDPLAEGVMQVGVASATKLLDYLPSDKIYVASFKLGYITKTFDSEAEEEFIKEPNITEDELISVTNSFIGKSLQYPPKYSAIKQNGKKLCDLARKNIDIEIKPREVEITSIKLTDFNGFNEGIIEVECKKGTYIRSLINDIGLKIGCGAYLTKLIRTKAGNFDIKNSNKLDDLNLNKINPLEALDMNRVELTETEYNDIMLGKFIKNKTNLNHCKILLVYNKKLVSIAEISDNLIRPRKNFKGI